MLNLCGLPKLNFLICLMHFGVWGKKRLKKFWQSLNFSLKSFILKIIWSHEHTCHIIKNWFPNISVENIFQNFPKFLFFETRPIEPFLWSIEMWRRKNRFSFKSLGLPRFLLNSSGLIELIFMLFSIPIWFLLTDWILNCWNK